MAFGLSDCNLKIKAPDAAGDHLVRALDALEPEGKKFKVTRLEKNKLELKDHFQGVVVLERDVLLTTSAHNGRIIGGRRSDSKPSEYRVECVTQAVGDHPGGIQTVGSYLVVPTYGPPLAGEESEIRFYRYDGSIRPVQRLTIKRDRKSYCLGITNCCGVDGDYYVLVVVSDSDGNELHFYRTQPGIPLGDDHCKFQPIGSWNYDTLQEAIDKRDWAPDRQFRGYPNNISLIADDSGGLYFLGFCGRRSARHFKRDRADLFAVDLTADPTKMFRKLHSVTFRSRIGKPSFRYGGGALVTSDTTIALSACARNQFLDDDLTVRLYYADEDPLFG